MDMHAWPGGVAFWGASPHIPMYHFAIIFKHFTVRCRCGHLLFHAALIVQLTQQFHDNDGLIPLVTACYKKVNTMEILKRSERYRKSSTLLWRIWLSSSFSTWAASWIFTSTFLCFNKRQTMQKRLLKLCSHPLAGACNQEFCSSTPWKCSDRGCLVHWNVLFE